MRYAHFSEIYEKCGNMRNMQQSHIPICLLQHLITLNKNDILWAGPIADASTCATGCHFLLGLMLDN